MITRADACSPPLAASLRWQQPGCGRRSRTRNGAMQIKRSGSQPSAKGPAEYFTGTVRIDPLFQAAEPARVAGGHRHLRAGRAHAPGTRIRSARR